jgi:DNA polymerase-1
MDATKARREHGYVETIFGRRCHFPEIKSRSNPSERAFVERAGDQRADPGLGRRHHPPRHDPHGAALEAAGLDARMLLQVHDELIFEVPPPLAEGRGQGWGDGRQPRQQKAPALGRGS